MSLSNFLNSYLGILLMCIWLYVYDMHMLFSHLTRHEIPSPDKGRICMRTTLWTDESNIHTSYFTVHLWHAASSLLLVPIQKKMKKNCQAAATLFPRPSKLEGCLPHWPLRNVEVILQVCFSNSFYELITFREVVLKRVPQNPLIIRQYWFG